MKRGLLKLVFLLTFIFLFISSIKSQYTITGASWSSPADVDGDTYTRNRTLVITINNTGSAITAALEIRAYPDGTAEATYGCIASVSIPNGTSTHSYVIGYGSTIGGQLSYNVYDLRVYLKTACVGTLLAARTNNDDGDLSNENFETSTEDACTTPAQPGAISGNASVCSGTSQTYSISPVPGATSYSWATPSGWPDSGSQTSTSLTVNAGTLSGNLWVYANGCGGTSAGQKLSITVNTPPAQPGAISGNNSVCQGSSQTYSIVAVSGATTYTWTLPSGWTGSSNTNSITVTPSASSGNISVTANNSCGSSSAQTLSVTVTAIPAQPGTITGNTSVCQGSSQTYSIVAVSGATTYSWTLPSGWTGSSTTNSINVTPSATSGNISVTANNSCGSSSAQSLAVTATALPAQPGAITGNTSVCQGSSQAYSISAVSGAISYTWTLPSGWTGSSSTNSITTTVGSTGGTVSVTANNSCGASSPSPITVTVLSVPAQPGAITGNTTVCQGSSQNYSITAVSGATSYTWTLPSGWAGSSTTNSITATAGTTGGTISVKANNSCGSGNSKTLSVTVITTPSQPGTITGNTPVCQGSSQTYSIVAVSGATTYTWTLPSGWTGSSTTNSITVTPSSFSGNISVTANNSCGSSSAQSLAVTATALPAQPGTLSGSTTICQGSSQTYSIVAVSGATSYTWTLPSGWTGSSTTNSITTNAGTTGGTISVKANNSCGSGSPQTLAVTINSVPAQPGTITGNTSVCQGSSQTYSIVAVSGATSYTWTLPSGWTGSSITNSITATAGITGGIISVTANNSCGSGSPQTLTVTVNSVTTQPGTITGNTTICQGSSQAYSIADVSGATSYTWTLPSGWSGSSSTNSITITPSAANGSISVTANSSCGISSAQTLSITVSTVPFQPATITGNNSVCQGSSQTYSITEVSGASSYSWTLPSGWSGSSATNSITVTAGTTGGTISVTANNSCGSGSPQTLSVTVISTPAQPGSISGNASVCQGSSQNYSITAVSGATSYTWTLPSGWTGSSVTNSITATASSTSGNISVTANNTCGLSQIKSISVTSYAIQSPVIGEIVHPTCLVRTGSFIVNGLPSTGTWQVTLNPGPIIKSGTGTTTSVNGIVPGTYALTVENSLGCISTSIDLTINQVPSDPLVPVITEITQPICKAPKGSVRVNNLPTTGTWTLNGNSGINTTGSTGSATLNDLNPGSYSVSVTDARGCTSSQSATFIINTVSQGLIPVIKAKWDGQMLICINKPDSILNYSWYNGTTHITADTNRYYLTLKKAGTYTVRTTDIMGCNNVSAPYVYISTGSLITYPNPVSGGNLTIKLNYSETGKANLSLINGLGKKVIEYSIFKAYEELIETVNVSGLNEGVYTLIVNMDSELVFSTKVVIHK